MYGESSCYKKTGKSTERHHIVLIFMYHGHVFRFIFTVYALYFKKLYLGNAMLANILCIILCYFLQSCCQSLVLIFFFFS